VPTSSTADALPRTPTLTSTVSGAASRRMTTQGEEVGGSGTAVRGEGPAGEMVVDQDEPETPQPGPVVVRASTPQGRRRGLLETDGAGWSAARCGWRGRGAGKLPPRDYLRSPVSFKTSRNVSEPCKKIVEESRSDRHFWS
jgi:hypothetical protein